MENWVWIAVGGFLLADTFAVKWISNWNMGVLMPAILGAPLFFYGLFYQEAELWFQTEAGRIVKGIFVVGYVSFFLFFLFCIFLMERGKTRRMKEPPEAVIVLGGGLRGERPSRLLRKRLDTGKKLAEESRAILVVSGGQGRDEVISEAEAMRRYLEAQGFPRGRILMEDRSRSTYQNFLYSKKLLDAYFARPYRAAFVTSGFHVYRAGLVARKLNFAIPGVAAPSAWYMALNFYLRETLALLRYFLFGIV